MDGPVVSLIVPTFERPASLHLALTSLNCQTALSAGDMEIIVADDGSQDSTADIVSRFRRKSRFPVQFTTHSHDGFQLAKTRNDGVRVSKAPYLVFLDGDCVAPHDHVAQHLLRRRPQTVMGGYCYYIDRDTSAQIDQAAVEAGRFNEWPTREQKKKLTRLDWKSRLYSLMRHPNRPKLYGGAFGMWRRDYEAVNGFNEDYTGWGCEDDEFRMRLKRAGLRIRSILRWTRTYHLWHPPAPSCPQRWQDGPNVERLLREAQQPSSRCIRGLQKTAA